MFLVWQLVITWRLFRINDDLLAVYEGFRANNAEIDELRIMSGQLAETGLSLSRILGLPEPQYLQQQDNVEGNDNTSPFLPYFTAIDRIVEKRNGEVEALTLEQLYNAASFKNLLGSYALIADLDTRGGNANIVVEDKQGKDYLRISTNAGKAAAIEYTVQAVNGEKYILTGNQDNQGSDSQDGDSSNSIVTQITPIVRAVSETYTQYKEQVQALVNLMAEAPLREALRETGISASVNKDYPASLVLQKHGYELLTVSIDIKDLYFYIASTPFDIAGLRIHLLNTLQSGAIAAPNEEELKENEQILEALFADPGFLSYLEQRKLRVVMEPREDDEHIFYDIVDDDDKLVGSLALQFVTGDVWLMDKDGSPISSLSTLIQNIDETVSAKPTKVPIKYDLPTQDSDDGLSILLIGTHENMADAIIIAYLAPESNKISLFSIPRDLYYRGKKINSIYAGFGPKLLVREIENITNLNIDYYIAIDMFAFIDAVNAVGGVDIVLNEALIDPTYRIKVNGRWSTLYYSAGSHHVNGIEALRVARSRGTSSDFDRAARQQKILMALYKKISNLSVLKDSEKLYSLLRILFSYVRSDLNIVNVISYLQQYSDSSIGRQIVLDTSNVLYNTYTNLRLLKDGDPIPEYKGQWILLPLDDNWDVISWFIHSNIQEIREG